MAEVYWDVTPRCNLRCEYCSVAGFYRTAAPPEPLGRKEALAGLDAFALAGVTKLHLLGGEPTLCPWLPDLLAGAEERRIPVVIATNGTSWSERTFHWIARHPPAEICFSIDGCTPAQNDSLRGIGVFERSTAILRWLLEFRARMPRPPAVGVQCTLHRHNGGAVSAIARYFADLGADYILFERMSLLPGRSDFAKAAFLGSSEIIQVAERIAVAAAELQGRIRVDLGWGRMALRGHLHRAFGFPLPPHRLCGGGHEYFHVDATGRAYPCQHCRNRGVPRDPA